MRIRIWLVLGVIVGLSCRLSWAELISPEEFSSPETETKGALVISMDFKDANLKDILKIFSQQSGLNFIAGENIAEKKVTLYVDNVSVPDALNSIMEANNLTYEQGKSSRVFIVKDSGKPAVETKTNVYYLKYAQVSAFAGKEKSEEDIIKVMTALLSSHGKLLVDERTNSIIITDIPTRFSLIEKTIAKLDVKTPQVMIEVEILDTKLSAAEDLGLEWGTSIASFNGPRRGTHFPLGKGKEAGASVTPAFTLGILSLTELSFTLDMLTSNTDAKILARPRILTLSNETAKIDISADTAVSLKSSVVFGEQTTTVTTEEVERVETGISLEVTPQVSEDGYITMAINPKVISAVPSKDLGGAFNYYDTDVRGAETTVRVKDGETIVIGGLIKTNDTEIIKKVPFLGDVPFLGWMFRNKNVDSEQRELIIFITPYIVKEDVYLAEAPSGELWLPAEREQKPSTSKEEAMEDALSGWER